jgi:hypothetical protein
MSFDHLFWATKIANKTNPYFRLVSDWGEKRKHLSVYILTLPDSVQEYKNSESRPYDADPRITIVNSIPRIRLASMCEAAANCLYSLAELSAQFGSKTSKGIFPASFNHFRKKLEKGEYGNDLLAQIGDLQWYRKVREIRTEWVHHSTIFIGKRDNEPIMVIRAYRRTSDREEFSADIQVTIPELIDWMEKAIHTIDSFGGFLLKNHIIPSLPLDDEILLPKYDQNGFPIILPDNRFDTEKITVREYLQRGGIAIE